MASTLTLPKRVYAGDSFVATLADADRPSTAGWTAKLRLISSATAVEVDGTPAAAGFTFSVSTTASAGLLPGSYTAAALLTRAGERATVLGAALEVRPDPAGAAVQAIDLRSPARRRLEGLEAAYQQYIDTGALMSSYQIAGRQVTFHSLADLIMAIERARRDVAAEAAAADFDAGRGPRGAIVTRM